MKRFRTDIKLFVLNERAEGKGWKAIKQRIEDRFHVKPPTTRAMQKWEKNLDREALTTELMKDMRSAMPEVEAETQVRFATDLLPMLWKAKDAGQDWELAGWKWFLRIIDSRLGNQRFEHLVREYMSERAKDNTE